MFAFSTIIVALIASSTGQENSCIITEFSQASKVVEECTDIIVSNLTVPGGRALMLNLTKGSKVTFEGTTKFELGYWEGHLVQVFGENVLVQGAPGSVLDAQGQKYWDGKGGSGGVTKPKFFSIKTTGGSVFKNINLLNCAHFCVGVTATDVHITGWNIDVVAGNKKGAKNTDGFGVSHSENVLIENCVVKNQDDCVVVNSGSNMIFRNMECHGSHGLSFSVGSSTTDVANGRTNNITFQNSKVVDGLYGIHLKTKRGTGFVSDVTYKNIEFSGLTSEGIYINQDYGDTGNTSRQIQISNLEISNVHGSVKGKKAIPVHIVCNHNACSNWQWSNITITGRKKNVCNYKPTGFSC